MKDKIGNKKVEISCRIHCGSSHVVTLTEIIENPISFLSLLFSLLFQHPDYPSSLLSPVPLFPHTDHWETIPHFPLQAGPRIFSTFISFSLLLLFFYFQLIEISG